MIEKFIAQSSKTAKYAKTTVKKREASASADPMKKQDALGAGATSGGGAFPTSITATTSVKPASGAGGTGGATPGASTGAQPGTTTPAASSNTNTNTGAASGGGNTAATPVAANSETKATF